MTPSLYRNNKGRTIRWPRQGNKELQGRPLILLNIMAHHYDYEEKVCKYCSKTFWVRESDCPAPIECLYCSDKCAANDTFPAGWLNKGTRTKRQRIKKNKKRWV